MAHPPYSVQMIAGEAGSSATATALAYTVPVGKVAVVRCVDVLITGAGTIFVGQFFPQYALWVSTSGLAYHQTKTWNGRQVLGAGAVLGVGWYSGSAMIRASGYLLSA